MNSPIVIKVGKTLILFFLLFVCISTAEISKLCHDQHEVQADGCNILIINRVIKALNWRRFFIIYSLPDEMVVTEMLISFKHRNLVPPQASVWDVTNMSSVRMMNLLSIIYGDGFGEVRIIFILNNDTVKFLQMADNFDDLSNKTTNYHTNSKWIVLDLRNLPSTNIKSFRKLRDVLYVRSCNAFVVQNDLELEVDCLKAGCGALYWEFSNRCSVDEIFPDAKYKLNGRHLRIGTLNNDIFGLIVRELSKALAQALNFTYTFHVPEDRRYGHDINGNWTGVIGQLQRREVDLVVEEITVTEDRMKVVDFIRPAFLSQEFGILYRRGVELESTWYRIFKPLRTDVYWCILAALCFVGGLLYLLENSVDSNVGFRFIRFFYIMVDLVGFISVRGSGLWPRSESARVLVAVFWMFCVVVTGVYIGNLTAKITGTREKKPFDSLEELIQTDWKWGINKDGLTMQMIRSSKVKSIQELWNGIVKFNITDPRVLDLNFENQLEYVLNTTWKYAFIVLDPKFYILNRNDCLIVTTDAHIISNLHIALAVPKQSYLKPELERVMSKLLDNGFISIIHDMRYKDNRPWTCKNTSRIRTTNLEDVQGLLLIVCVGLGIALTVLILELLSKLSQRR